MTKKQGLQKLANAKHETNHGFDESHIHRDAEGRFASGDGSTRSMLEQYRQRKAERLAVNTPKSAAKPKSDNSTPKKSDPAPSPPAPEPPSKTPDPTARKQAAARALLLRVRTIKGKEKPKPEPTPVAERPAPKGIVELSPDDISFDPKRFQYKIVHGETGASGSLTGVQKWDENLAGLLQLWRDPADGKDYVVNGHNRLSLAKRLGAEKVTGRYLDVKTAEEARAIAALTNIAEGRGNALDSAKFFRDSGISREDLEAKGIPMKEKIATDGLALSKLAPHLFDKVVQGEIPQERAVLIGERVSNHDEQNKLVELIDKEQKKGRKLNNDVVRELADAVQAAPSHSETQMNLFGAEETTRNLALERAEVMAEMRRRLSREKNLFGTVSRSKAAQELEKGGNVIDAEKSKDISDQAAQTLGVFDELKNKTGEVSHAINEATTRIAKGESRKAVLDDLHSRLVRDIPEALGLRKRESDDGNLSLF